MSTDISFVVSFRSKAVTTKKSRDATNDISTNHFFANSIPSVACR
jgi:hypothetical protein